MFAFAFIVAAFSRRAGVIMDVIESIVSTTRVWECVRVGDSACA